MRCALIAATGRARRVPFLINAQVARVRYVRLCVKKKQFTLIPYIFFSCAELKSLKDSSCL
jgi:hypothetical protein